MVGIAEGRSNVYHLLSRIYLKELTPEVLAVLMSREVKETLKDLGMDIDQALPDTLEDNKLLDALATEYAALFIVPGGIPPYESVRLKGLLCQEPEREVREFYRRCGLTIKEDCKVFADHLGMELEFMGYLVDKEAEAWKNGGEESAREWVNLQKEFFSNHLDKWVFGFLKDMDMCAFHPFYKGLGRLTRAFLETEKEEMMLQGASFIKTPGLKVEGGV